MAYCSNCGKKLETNVKFCPECGSPVNVGQQMIAETPPPIPSQAFVASSQETQPQQQIYVVHRKSKGVALILCLFFGGIGIHDFYLGRYFWGIMSVLFCWTFLPLIGSIIDFFIILFTPESVFHEMYDK